MIRALYDWTLLQAEKPWARRTLFGVAFAESSFFPIPPDVLLIPMVLAQRGAAWLLAALCTAGSITGALAGYAIGYYLFDAVGQPILELYGYAEKFASFTAKYNDHGAWIVLGAALTPFPYKVITIASGVTGLSLPVFLVASIVGRAARFFLVAALLWFFGEPIRRFIDRWFGLLTLGFFALLAGGFVLIGLL
ncbi:MAG: DedA family protein [Alphaproteobacteria bacterium]|nr:DedA family protein [Alphaproteobacteria bacterium]